MDRMDAIRNAEAWQRESPHRYVSITIGSGGRSDSFSIYAHDYNLDFGMRVDDGLIDLERKAAEQKQKARETAITTTRELLAALEAEGGENDARRA